MAVPARDCQFVLLSVSTDGQSGPQIFTLQENFPGLSQLLTRISAPFTAAFNDRTILQGTQRKWDSTRIHEGKLSEYRELGAQEILIRTSSGDIEGCYFSAAEFKAKLGELGGHPALLRVVRNLPILQLAQPVVIKIKSTLGFDDHSAVRIRYNSAYSHLFKNPAQLCLFCEQQGLVVVQDNKLKKADFWKTLFGAYDLFIMRRNAYELIVRNSEAVTIVDTDQFSGILACCSPDSYELPGSSSIKTVNV